MTQRRPPVPDTQTLRLLTAALASAVIAGVGTWTAFAADTASRPEVRTMIAEEVQTLRHDDDQIASQLAATIQRLERIETKLDQLLARIDQLENRKR